MKVVLEQTQYHRFALYYDYDPAKVVFCQQLRDSFGWQRFSFNNIAGKKRWIFSDSLFIPVLKEAFPELEVEQGVLDVVNHEIKWSETQTRLADELEEIRHKEDTDFQVNGIKRELYPYQRVGVEFLVKSGGRALLSDDMGLGKSLQTIAYSEHVKHKRVLVVCPASVKFSWANEIQMSTNEKSFIVDSKTDLSKIDHKIKYWIINYDILKKHLSQLLKIHFDAIFADECHLLKTPQSIRSKSFRILSREIKDVILISGTPFLSRPAELFSLLNIIDPKTWDNWYAYARRYCNLKQTRWGIDVSGSSNTEELHKRIKRYFIRRLKQDVLKDLPPRRYMDIPVELDPKWQKDYDLACTNYADFLRQKGKNSGEIVKLLGVENLQIQHTLRYLAVMGKVGSAIEVIENMIQSGEKIIVFCSFLDPIRELEKHFEGQYVTITSETKNEDRGEMVKKFQTDPKIKVFFGGFMSAGVGITLTAASQVLFLDYPWNPSDAKQAGDRAHRIGQKAEQVDIYQLHAPNTIDEDAPTRLSGKQDLFDVIIDGKEVKKLQKQSAENVKKRILQNY